MNGPVPILCGFSMATSTCSSCMTSCTWNSQRTHITSRHLRTRLGFIWCPIYITAWLLRLQRWSGCPVVNLFAQAGFLQQNLPMLRGHKVFLGWSLLLEWYTWPSLCLRAAQCNSHHFNRASTISLGTGKSWPLSLTGGDCIKSRTQTAIVQIQLCIFPISLFFWFNLPVLVEHLG